MSILVLQEVLLALTFVLTLINLINGWNAARTRKTATDPAIIAIREQMVQMGADVSYIRATNDTQWTALSTGLSEVNRRVDGLVNELAALKTEVSLNTARHEMKGG